MKNKNWLEIIHNVIVTIIVLISAIVLFNKNSPELIKDGVIWSIIAGLAYRMVFDLKEMNFTIGAMFCTAVIFVFPWWYIPFIYILCHSIYAFSCVIVKDANTAPKRTFWRAYFVHGNTILVAIISALIKNYFIPGQYINLSEDVVILFIVCIIESSIGLIFIYGDLKYRDMISSIIVSIAKHIKDTYGIYIIYFCMVITITIMYQNYSYLGMILASSYVLALQFAYDKQAKVIQIEEESYKDILTGVKNKKYYIEHLPEKFTRKCAIFFIDFNGFKGINDKYGHDIGDAVIIHGARILSRVVREKDDIIRFGGDEFMLLISDADEEVCQAIITRIETFCKEILFEEKNISIQISMAIGIAMCPKESSDKEELLVLADEKMYEAKKNKNGLDIVYKM